MKTVWLCWFDLDVGGKVPAMALVGAFSDRAKAVAACLDSRYCVGELTIDFVADPVNAERIPNCCRPNSTPPAPGVAEAATKAALGMCQ